MGDVSCLCKKAYSNVAKNGLGLEVKKNQTESFGEITERFKIMAELISLIAR